MKITNSFKWTALGLAATFAVTVAVMADDTNSVASTSQLPPDSTKTGLTYATDIKPIFDSYCVKCHDSAKKARGGLALNTLDGILKGGKDGKAIIPGNSANSDLVLAVAHVGDDPDEFMPKGKNATPVSSEQIGLIRAWVDQGAK